MGRKIPDSSGLPHFRDDLWGPAGGAQARSAEATPLYVHRHRGVHGGTIATRHPFWELLVVFRGEGVLHAEAGQHPFGPDTALLTPPGLPHGEASSGETDVLWVALAGRRLDALAPDRVLRAEGAESERIAEALWLRAERAYGRIGPELDGLAGALLACVLRLAEEAPGPDRDLIDEAALHLARRYAEPINLAALAARMGVSQGHFQRSFKRRTGETPGRYLERVRMRHALRWLHHTALPVGRIARLVGYRDPLYFSRAFRRATGQSPTAAREAQEQPDGTDARG
ncbi:MAG: AraC family transcriptional regulator [Planctomycetota bacterium]